MLFIILIDSSLKWAEVDKNVFIEISSNWILLHKLLLFVWMEVSP